MKFLKKLLVSIFSIVVVAAIIVVSGYFIIKKNYGIDLLNTYKQLSILSKEVDKLKLITNGYDDSDLLSMEETLNNKTNGFIYRDENGNLKINYDKPSIFNDDISLTDKQVAAYAQKAIEQEMNSKITVGNYEFGLELKQIDFSNIKDGNCLFNVIIKLDLTSLETTLSKFPYSLVKKYIPKYLYISSNVNVNKGSKPFEYDTISEYLTINNLEKEDSKELVTTLNTILKTGTYDDLNLKISNEILYNLIGDEEHNGLAYSLKNVGAKDYTFSTISNVDYFVVKTGLF